MGAEEWACSLLVDRGVIKDAIATKYVYDKEEYIWPHVRELRDYRKSSRDVPAAHLARAVSDEPVDCGAAVQRVGLPHPGARVRAGVLRLEQRQGHMGQYQAHGSASSSLSSSHELSLIHI